MPSLRGIEPVENVAGALGVFHIILAVKCPHAVAEHAMHAGRTADGAPAAARQVGHPLGRADAHGGGIEQQEVGLRADREPATVRDAVEVDGMAGQAAMRA